MFAQITSTEAIEATATGKLFNTERIASDLKGVAYIVGTLAMVDGRNVAVEVYSAREVWAASSVGGHLVIPPDDMREVFRAMGGVDIWNNERP